MKDISNARGTVFTFYSYKGGVGRSMALANVATLLAKWGKRTLVIDWDLEAPGIQNYFENDPHYPEKHAGLQLSESVRRAPGVIDMILGYMNNEPIDWRRCAIKVSSNRFRGGKLSIISAGRQDEHYTKKVQGMNWTSLFDETDFGSYLEHMREEWLEEYDYILIDSRTGITDIGGICTIHLPDIIVLMFTANQQSLEGVKDVFGRARKQHQNLPFDRQTLLGVPVLSRDESKTEYETALRWRKYISKELGNLYADWLPKNKAPKDILELLKIPYIAYWSFGERLPVIEEGTSDPTSIGFAFEILARAVVGKLQWQEIVVGPVSVGSEEDRRVGSKWDEQDYLKNRVDAYELLYRRKARMDQLVSMSIPGLQIFFAFTIVFSARFATPNRLLITIILGGLIAFLASGYQILYERRKSMLNYLQIVQALRSEKYQYRAKAPPYDSEDPFSTFVETIENIILKEETPASPK